MADKGSFYLGFAKKELGEKKKKRWLEVFDSCPRNDTEEAERQHCRRRGKKQRVKEKCAALTIIVVYVQEF